MSAMGKSIRVSQLPGQVLPRSRGEGIRRRIFAALVLPAILLAGWCVRAQAQSSGSASVPPSIFGDDPFEPANHRPPDPFVMQSLRKRERALNVERQKLIVADTNRLVKMVSDLNAGINSRQPSQLTADQMQLLAEIEKLAHTIRDKMSNPIRLPVPNAEPDPFRHRY